MTVVMPPAAAALVAVSIPAAVPGKLTSLHRFAGSEALEGLHTL